MYCYQNRKLESSLQTCQEFPEVSGGTESGNFVWEKCEGWRWLELLSLLGRVSLPEFPWVNGINIGSQNKAIFNNPTQENGPTLRAPSREMLCVVNCLRAARRCIIHIRQQYGVGTGMLQTTWTHTSRRLAFGCLPWQREFNSQGTITSHQQSKKTGSLALTLPPPAAHTLLLV